jgi:hypothetical protein
MVISVKLERYLTRVACLEDPVELESCQRNRAPFGILSQAYSAAARGPNPPA